MAFDIDYSNDAERQIKQLSARDQKIVLDAIEDQLRHEPARPTRNRKKLRDNPLAQWELRVFYDIMEADVTVAVIAIAEKRGNKYFIEGKEYPL